MSAQEPNPMIILFSFGSLFLFLYFLVIRPLHHRKNERAYLGSTFDTMEQQASKNES